MLSHSINDTYFLFGVGQPKLLPFGLSEIPSVSRQNVAVDL
nr:MAG TPA: hypothetical protein [Bacteriophage sp.]